MASSNIAKRRLSAKSDGGSEYKAKRDELIEIATRLFRERGYTATRLADIANEAHIDRASLYYYVGNKEELFQEALGGIVQSNAKDAKLLAADSSKSAAERINAVLSLLMRSYSENFPQMFVYIQEQMHQIARDESPWAQGMRENTRTFERIIVKLIAQGISDGEFRDDIDPVLSANALFGMLNWTYRWFTPQGKYTHETVSSAFNAIFMNGMSKHQGDS